MLKVQILLVLTLFLCSNNYANTITVDSTNNAGSGSLRQAISNAVSGDTIRFNSNLIANGSDSIVLDSTIKFNKSLTIIGLYTAIDTLFLSGGYNDRIFYVDNTAYLSLDSMVLIHADTAAVQTINVDSIVLNHSIFKHNLSRYYSAFYSYGVHRLIVNECLFQSNFGSGVVSTFNNYPNSNIKMVNITKSRFIGNGNRGLYLSGWDSLPVIIDSCLFLGNSDGGIAFQSGRLNATILNSTITQNSAVHYGGGVYLKTYHYVPQRPTSQLLDIFNTTINNNTASKAGGGVYTKFYDNKPEITRDIRIRQSSICNNTVTDSLGQGGGIYSEFYGGPHGDATLLNNGINIEQTTITGNTSLYQGGGIYSESSVPPTRNANNVSIKNSTITNNNSNSGGGVFMDTNQYHSSFTVTQLNIVSSIIALNGDSNIRHYQSPFMVSGGHNIFSESTLSGAVSTDILNADSTSLNLTGLSFNGGQTKTVMPMIPSIAKDNGDPIDTTNAQNLPIFGIRDAGAAEVCYSVGFDSATECSGYSWVNNITYYSDTIFTDTLVSSVGCDSVITLNLSINEVNTSVVVNSLNMIAQARDATFQWLNCVESTSIQDSTLSSFAVTESGSYAVEVTQNGCVDTSACEVFTNVGLVEKVSNPAIYIYPNPVINELNIRLINLTGTFVQLDVVNANGKNVLSQTYALNPNKTEVTVDTQSLKSGIYFIQIHNQTEIIITTRFIVR